MNYNLVVVLFCTFIAFSAFYAPQPLLPLLSAYFSVPGTTAALLITVNFAALCVAPLFYGALLQRVSSKYVLVIAFLLLSATQWWFASAENFSSLMASRVAQALLYPAIFTAAVTYCSQAGPLNKVAHRVSLYIAFTIMGGLLGRVGSGFIASWYDWTMVFEIAGILLLFSCVLLMSIKTDRPAIADTKSHAIAKEILTNPTFLSGYLLIFTTFYAFSATLNALPFRLVEIEPGITPARISIAYSGYVVGMLIATNSSRIANRIGGRVRAMTVALSIFTIGLLLLNIPVTSWLIAICFLTAAGMFLIHSTLSGFLTSLRPNQASVVNGLYIAIYYGAGALGSVLPLWIYNHFGWRMFLFSITAVALLGFVSLKRLSLESIRHTNRLAE